MIRHLVPDQTVGAVVDLDPARLVAEGIRGLIVDLDDTLVCEAERAPTDPVCAWMAHAQEHLKVVILSNNSRRHRVAPVATTLSVPFIHRACKPLLLGFRRALALLDLPAWEVAVVGDQVFTDVLGGRRLGARTILVTPMTPQERKWHRKAMRGVERAVLRGTHAAGFQGASAAIAPRAVPSDAERVQSNNHAAR